MQRNVTPTGGDRKEGLNEINARCVQYWTVEFERKRKVSRATQPPVQGTYEEFILREATPSRIAIERERGPELWGLQGQFFPCAANSEEQDWPPRYVGNGAVIVADQAEYLDAQFDRKSCKEGVAIHTAVGAAIRFGDLVNKEVS